VPSFASERLTIQEPLVRYAVEVGWDLLPKESALTLRRGESGTLLYQTLRDKLLPPAWMAGGSDKYFLGTDAFGRDILSESCVDRRALAARAFRSPADVRRLNALVHPHVARVIRRQIRAARGVFILDAALLQEAGADAWCDRVVHVHAPRSVRERRAAIRGWPAGDLRRRERYQCSTALKRARADHVIDNSGPPAAAQRQVERLYRMFVQLLGQ
jgi:dephospho-CoA kinase